MCHLIMFCGRLCLGQRLPQHTLAALRTACRQHKRLSVHCACLRPLEHCAAQVPKLLLRLPGVPGCGRLLQGAATPPPRSSHCRGRWQRAQVRALALDGVPCAQACLACKGAILFTGIGKSGFIAQKVCQTLVSTGTKAVFLNPTDALHGDIGILGRDDLVVLMSKSGATDELLRLVPYARVRAARALHMRQAACRTRRRPPPGAREHGGARRREGDTLGRPWLPAGGLYLEAAW